tara:strand:- start:11026 stop:11337 length:312 start_codon:yes stop_codon:yes gene_type:complete
MNNLPEELQLHILTYIKVLSVELKPLLLVNKSMRNLLWNKEFTLDTYPYMRDESVACICKSYLDYMNDLIRQRREMEEESIMNDTDEEIEEIEHYSYFNFAPF